VDLDHVYVSVIVISDGGSRIDTTGGSVSIDDEPALDKIY
jgi:hypothetical protein